jgi:hypothetical protein
MIVDERRINEYGNILANGREAVIVDLQDHLDEAIGAANGTRGEAEQELRDELAALRRDMEGGLARLRAVTTNRAQNGQRVDVWVEERLADVRRRLDGLDDNYERENLLIDEYFIILNRDARREREANLEQVLTGWVMRLRNRIQEVDRLLIDQPNLLLDLRDDAARAAEMRRLEERIENARQAIGEEDGEIANVAREAIGDAAIAAREAREARDDTARAVGLERQARRMLVKAERLAQKIAIQEQAIQEIGELERQITNARQAIGEEDGEIANVAREAIGDAAIAEEARAEEARAEENAEATARLRREAVERLDEVARLRREAAAGLDEVARLVRAVPRAAAAREEREAIADAARLVREGRAAIYNAAAREALARAERLKAESAEAERLEIQAIEALADAERLAREARAALARAERLRAEGAEAEEAEAARLAAENAEAERLRSRLEAERAEAERAEAERLNNARAEAARAEEARLRKEAASAEAERLRLEAESAKAASLAAERKEIEKILARRRNAGLARLEIQARATAARQAIADAERLGIEEMEAGGDVRQAVRILIAAQRWQAGALAQAVQATRRVPPATAADINQELQRLRKAEDMARRRIGALAQAIARQKEEGEEEERDDDAGREERRSLAFHARRRARETAKAKVEERKKREQQDLVTAARRNLREGYERGEGDPVYELLGDPLIAQLGVDRTNTIVRNNTSYFYWQLFMIETANYPDMRFMDVVIQIFIEEGNLLAPEMRMAIAHRLTLIARNAFLREEGYLAGEMIAWFRK